jgi:hypothetical protein
MIIFFFQITVKTCKGVRAQWSTESLKPSVSAVMSGTLVAAASGIFSISRKITGLLEVVHGPVS